MQEGEEIGQVITVKGLGEFSQDKFTPVGDFGGDDAGGIAPIVLIFGREIRWRTWLLSGGKRLTLF